MALVVKPDERDLSSKIRLRRRIWTYYWGG